MFQQSPCGVGHCLSTLGYTMARHLDVPRTFLGKTDGYRMSPVQKGLIQFILGQVQVKKKKGLGSLDESLDS
jgi:hypothetical protein